MNKTFRAVLLGALALVASVSAAAALDRRVNIHNTSAYDIYYFYASNTGTDSWEEDILGNDILPAGRYVTINIDDGSGYCMYDFKAVFVDGEEVVSWNNNVCELTDFYFTD
jgi:uncharacterized protein (DUF2147 family)